MFEIRGNDIYISRGEAAVLSVTPMLDGEVYTLDPLEKLRLTVFDTTYADSKLKIDSALGDVSIKIRSEDTKRLCGLLGYSVKLVYADGSDKTIIGPTPTYIPRFYVLEG